MCGRYRIRQQRVFFFLLYTNHSGLYLDFQDLISPSMLSNENCQIPEFSNEILLLQASDEEEISSDISDDNDTDLMQAHTSGEVVLLYVLI